VDLFTSWQRRGEFPELAAAVIAALEAAGYKASVIMSAETFTRLILTDPEDGSEEKVELSVDWRAHEPVQLGVGPVLHADDAVANKVCALFGRALPRDFLDVDAAITSGRYTREQLLELAAEADRGFDRLPPAVGQRHHPSRGFPWSCPLRRGTAPARARVTRLSRPCCKAILQARQPPPALASPAPRVARITMRK
jgi:hypothetical protein